MTRDAREPQKPVAQSDTFGQVQGHRTLRVLAETPYPNGVERSLGRAPWIGHLMSMLRG
jgi:hypothetical protein